MIEMAIKYIFERRFVCKINCSILIEVKLKYINYFFLFFSIIAFLSFFSVGIFSHINLIIVVLYFNSIILITNKSLNIILKNLMFFISVSIFIYLIYLIYIHMNLGSNNLEFTI